MVLQVVLEALGIDHVAETVVGSEMIRGVSGGEKRRLTLAKELASGHPIIVVSLELFWAPRLYVAARCIVSGLREHVSEKGGKMCARLLLQS